MELKKDEVMIKEGQITLEQPFGINLPRYKHGSLYLTNQRLVCEYFSPGVPLVNLFSRPPKKVIEIPVTSIKYAKRARPFSLETATVEVYYNIGGETKFLVIFPSNLEIADEWVAQILRVANVKPDEKTRALYETFSPVKLFESIVLLLLSVIAAFLLAFLISFIYHIINP